jgi:hypothetical protein
LAGTCHNYLMAAFLKKKQLIIEKVGKALDSDEKLTRSEFKVIASKIFSEIMKSQKGVKKDDLVQEKQKRSPTRWNRYLQDQIAVMKAEDSAKPKTERRTSRTMFKVASEKWKSADSGTYK